MVLFRKMKSLDLDPPFECKQAPLKCFEEHFGNPYELFWNSQRDSQEHFENSWENFLGTLLGTLKIFLVTHGHTETQTDRQTESTS